MTKRDHLILKALDEWEDTPESLGEVLQTAISPLEPLPWPGSSMWESVYNRRQEVQAARARLRHTSACRKLLEFELRESLR